MPTSQGYICTDCYDNDRGREEFKLQAALVPTRSFQSHISLGRLPIQEFEECNG